MAKPPYRPKKGFEAEPKRDGYEDLQQEMADAAGEAARNMADAAAQAVGAITVAFGLKLARPLAETAEDLGAVLGETLQNMARRPDSEWEDLEVISVDFQKKD